jgi:hypothetical protein
MSPQEEVENYLAAVKARGKTPPPPLSKEALAILRK